MSTYVEGLADIYSITAKIQELKQNAGNLSTNSNQTVDIEESLLQMQRSFSSMLNNLMFSSNDDDDNSSDPFSFYNSSAQQLQNLSNPTLNTLNIQNPNSTI
ncbi:hypothetical protein A2291_00270 [candidate division WOR-1 bacterium RIFOXYB2_FULL_42_35]|uniref:Uncharacterized protein n=1 Tax=candidate division WOR-1 bacterium RIFOXYC2_FULL_41_25 TaxID=1802586 RepID=A0A1F4TMB4_UNCSA|nr:MAG: hypothetical protein A2247_02925 [candidate division WOR-1 bacterium RIFOXYA2_FULL_41_14]OGC24147.1 MAG: hypothetical protein A2291_00270 [candidate division WOR-1 bacterium RIFOXYB2_FULL_42_35]OGC33834.1 MAG: hypothetical protein A2462_01945 [candidate division WOR-1 bacterium RIFOXYC2_FULL_41_25]OGC41808.1 MAG: hypothetical protein A2548_03915 [candidate division WOR-1 bacterium RIFOXYD2_FULL_41_8]